MLSKVKILRPVVSDSLRTLSAALSENPPTLHPRKLFSTSQIFNIRKIQINEEDADAKSGKRNVSIEGVVSELPKQTVILPKYSKVDGCTSAGENCHPLCRLSSVHEIKHTDVLILKQFIDHEGKMINREVTGLCRRQHVRMTKLIKMAAKAGLLPSDLDIFREEKKKIPAAKLNSYWDEATIDIQWLEIQRKEKIRSFKK